MDPFDNTNLPGAFAPSKPVDIREILHKYIYHWPVFVLTLFLALSAAFLYLRYTTKIYKVEATIIINDEKAESRTLSIMGLNTDSKGIDNEIEILQSKPLMKAVVQDLDVNIVYKTKGVAVMSDIYSSSPIKIIFRNKELIGTAKWTIEILDSSTYRFVDEESETTLNGKFGQNLSTRYGTCVINKTVNFASYLNTTIYVFLQDADVKAAAVLSNMSLTPIKQQASVLNISLNEEVSQRGKDILNKLIKVYSLASIEYKNRSSFKSIEYIKDRLKFLDDDLRVLETKADNFRSENNITDVSSQASSLQEIIMKNDERLNELNLQMTALADIQSYINSNDRNARPPFVTGFSDAGLQAQAKQYRDLLVKRTALLRTVPEKNRLVTNLDEEIAEAKENITIALGGIRSVLNRERSNLRAKNSSIEASMSTLPLHERQLMNMERERGIKENLYVSLLQRLLEAELTSATTLADNRVIEEAFGSKKPIKPEEGFAYMLAFVLGIFLPTAYVFTKDEFNFRVINAKDISDRTSAPILGDVMFQDDAESIVLDDKNRSPIAEQFRSIRTNLQYIFGREKGPRVILFTSSMSGEGKSFISSNIATALAMTGRKTVILELDLRKPKIAKYLKLKNRTGLSNYFIGQAAKEEIISESGVHENLYVITSGPIPPNPAELLEQKGMDDLISWLRTQFDEIIIDTPPIGLVTDALILARLADASIYVVRHGVTLKSQVLAIEDLNRAKKFPKLNIIHNGIKLSGRYGYGYASTYGYGYGYGYGHSYGYGYYDKPSRKKKKGLHLHPILADFLKRF